MTAYPLWLTDLCSEATNQKMRVYKSPSCHKSNHQMVSTEKQHKIKCAKFLFQQLKNNSHNLHTALLTHGCLSAFILNHHTLIKCLHVYPHQYSNIVPLHYPYILDKSCYLKDFNMYWVHVIICQPIGTTFSIKSS